MQEHPPDLFQEWVFSVFASSLGNTEKRVGLAPGTLKSVAALDDWGFVVQINALIETAITQLLLRWFVNGAQGQAQERLRRAFSKLPPRTKLDFAVALGLSKRARSATERIAELRNPVAHNIAKAVTFSFGAHVAGLTPGELNKLHGALGLNRYGEEAAKLLRKRPKAAVVVAATDVLNELEELQGHRRLAQGLQREGVPPPTLAAYQEENRRALLTLLESPDWESRPAGLATPDNQASDV